MTSPSHIDAASYSSSAEKKDTEFAHRPVVSPSDALADEWDEQGLKRDLKPRHLTFISIGACIGTGIFLGVGNALKNGGPLGLLLGYVIIASVMISVVMCTGEMTTFLPVSGGHLRLMGRFVDPSLSAVASWNYWLVWSLILAAEMSAASVLISYWNTGVHPAVWITLGLLIALSFNAFGAKIYGEAEFWFASLKVIAIVGLIITGICITSGASPSGETIGFRFWRDPGPLVQYDDIPGTTGRFLGFFAVLTQASFSLIGAEMLALAAAETRNPRSVLPIALRTVWIRVCTFYILGVFVIGIIVPSNNSRLGTSSTGAASPYVIAIETAGIKGLPSVVNAAILTSALSAGCSDLYTTSRSLYALSQKGQGPRIFTRTMSNGVPWVAVLASWAVGCLAYLGVSSGSGTVFNFLVNLTALGGILTWAAIAFTYLRFRAGMKAQGIPYESLPWRSPIALPGAYWSLFIVGIVTIFNGWEVFRPGHWKASTFFSTYLPIAWCALGYGLFKFFTKSKFVSLTDMDFTSGLRRIVEDSETWNKEDEANRPTTKIGRALAFLC